MHSFGFARSGGARGPRHRLLRTLFVLALGATPAAGESPGLDAPVPVGPYLNGALPSRTPRDPASAVWDVVPAFPGLTLRDTLVIVPGPADGRLYVGARDGEVVSFPNQPDVAASTPFLDLRDRVAVVWDGGFLGMAFHPEFGMPGSPDRGHLYAYYSSHCPIDATGRQVDLAACNPSYPEASTGGFFGTWLRLSRFTVPDGESVADPASERVMLNIRLYNGSHRGGGMVFADDGTFWLTIGDQFRYETAQDVVDTLEGGALRLVVSVDDHGDGTWTCPAASHLPIRRFATPDETSGQLYCIPDDNPWLFPDGSAFEEYATIGHRNPHRLAKDPATGRLWTGEVGEHTREEVNVLEPGRNYGWPFREGKVAGPSAPPAEIRGILTDPVIDFERADAQAIIGGYVYRGTRLPELDGRYLAGDYVTRKIWAMELDEASMTATATELTTFDPGALGTWGQDAAGEVYLGSVAGPGPLYTLDRVGPSAPEAPALLSQTGAFASLATLAPADFWVPFDLNQSFWSDGARKWRWIALPNDGVRDTPEERIGFAAAADWSFPNGTVLMKHFELPVDENDPSATERLETRFLVKGEDAVWYGISYRWLPDGSDAALLTGPQSADYEIHERDGGTRVQTWDFPSRSQCLFCHNRGTSGPLGVRTHQLHRDFTYASTGRTDDQLLTWSHLGMLSPAVDPAALPGLLRTRAIDDPTASLEDRARGWLDANCSSCHRPGSGNRATFETRLTTDLASQGLVYGGVINTLGVPGARLITPGDLSTSVLYYRAATLGTVAMPPLAKHRVQQDGVKVLGEWIRRLDPGSPQGGVAYEYYEETGLSALPDFDALTPVRTGTAASFDISPRDRSDDFAFRFTGVLRLDTAGSYTFYTSSDDGSRLFVDDVLVVDNDGLHSLAEASGSIALGAGYHTIAVTYFEATGSQVLTVSLEGPGLPKQPIPAARLFRQVPAPTANEPPVLASPGARELMEHEPVALALDASDADGDLLWFQATGLPPGLTLDPATGVVSGSPVGRGVYPVVFGVSDGPAAASVAVEWEVVPEASAPLLVAAGATALALAGRRTTSRRPRP